MVRRREVKRERGTIDDAIGILGVSHRSVQDLAASGALPGAAKIGRRWTFDLAKLREYVEAREHEIWQRAQNVRNASHPPDASGRAARFTVVSGFKASSHKRGTLTQAIRRLRDNVSKD